MYRIPVVTKNLLIINALCFLGLLVGERHNVDLNDMLGLHFFLASDFRPYQLLTYMFMHGSFEHIFFNMFAVWMFGRIIEQILGSGRFLFYYIACGLGAGLCQELVQYFNYIGLEHTDVANHLGELVRGDFVIYNGMAIDINVWTTVGASGAVYGVLLAFGMLLPEERMFVFPIPFPVKAKYFVMGYAVLELMLARSNDGVAHYAHLGGMLFGFLILLSWKDSGNSGLFGKVKRMFRSRNDNNFHVYSRR